MNALQYEGLASAEVAIDEARNGRMLIVVDDNAGHELGSLIIPAQMATPDVINFMARFGKGLICLAITAGRARELDLDLLGTDTEQQDGQAFTTSIEARHGVSTGISAADRARTIAVAINTSSSKDDIVTPGHVFPIITRDGGVLVRAGHAEAGVDLARLAGLNPSAVICQIIGSEGAIATPTELSALARDHQLKIVALRDLIAYRRRHDHVVERAAQVTFRSNWGGEWTAITFRNRATGTEQIALVKGDIDPSRPTLVRMHAISTLMDIFGAEGEGAGVLRRSMEIINERGSGVIIAVNRVRNDRFSMALRARAGTLSATDIEQLRDYGVGAMILSELGIEEMILLTNAKRTLVALSGYGLKVVGQEPVIADL